ncbi:substrate-binding domain-containing protein [Rhodoplanes sp.]|uniref:substrate-binding domain-containing protein n=1 Tax=Rhodoplanes sp. TaxID=1968906 RepID=UPI0025E42765|nr:substrate-binding domain-containing protein [Rhodoplanes sp.]
MKFRVLAATAIALLFSVVANAAEIRVMSTQAPEQAYRALVPEFEKASGHKVTTIFSGTVDINKRLAAGETYDVLIMARPSIDEHTKSGKVVADSRVDLAKSGIVVAVRKGAPKPDISTIEAFKKTLLAAKSIGYSTGPSGVYLVTLFQRLGITDEIKDKLKQTPTGIFVGSILTSGEVEIGLQQVSELIAFPDCEIIGPLPANIQQMTQFTASIMVDAKSVDAAKEWIKFLVSPAGAAAFKKTGMEPG